MTQTLGDFLKSCEKEKINKELFSIMKKTVKETDVKGEALSKKLGISERLLEKVDFYLY